LVTAVSDGTDTIRGTAQDGTGNYADWILTISNQDANTTPTVTTTAGDSVKVGRAKTGGNVTDNGGAAVTARGVCWSESINPTISGNKTVDGTGTGAFTSTIYPMKSNTYYYIRAYATNEEGTAYGENRIILTPSFSVVSSGGKPYSINGQILKLE
jgi:hypothetical protein